MCVRMEYAYHIWGGSTYTVLLDRVESKVLRLIRSTHLTSSLLPLKFPRNVASLYPFCLSAVCPSELVNYMAPLFPRLRCTCMPFYFCSSSIQIPYTGVIQHLHPLALPLATLKHPYFVCISSCLRPDLFQEESIKIPLNQELTSLLAIRSFFLLRAFFMLLFLFYALPWRRKK